ncbi:zf-DHHC-domain-containing protein [Punctularia strigosozonata HHB-11173 SS5]|uniref:zf-DHHC-domain-containing protein n=1 Tax=Punctularia strigosozonata (strain HHB-11173) TaxID=741275 RepID=UPI0004417B46|nr:zf-DHHC-domain-containing protein [Punctularia strigosozonata HHB-11173 SS5]EIN13020.1 zf-DHHC-domain-containing protein [Punctularia strigosozonata HHB-11173 SS5]
MSRARPYLSFELQEPAGSHSPTSPIPPHETVTNRPWYHYLPLLFTVGLILSPHPSILIVLVRYHLQILESPLYFGLNLIITYTLTFLALVSLLVCVVRDPGPVDYKPGEEDSSLGDENAMSLTEALMGPGPTDDYSEPGKWCNKCWAPKPERTHHCSTCGRCVLKLDHHCMWLTKCLGHRTYPSFVHFLISVTLLATYIASLAIKSLIFAFTHYESIDETTPLHELFLAAEGLIFAMVVGSFVAYHLYLVTTNQTTLEHISPYLLLRYLPALPPSPSGQQLSNPPQEDELTYYQRRLVRRAHGRIRLYDIGWRQNWAQVFGIDGLGKAARWKVILYRLLCGGSSKGDGRTYPRNPRAEDMLANLATDLVMETKDL